MVKIMKSIKLNNLINKNEYNINSSSLEKLYTVQKEELETRNIKTYTVKEFIETIKSSKNFNLFKHTLNNIKKEYLYKSTTHGISHNERVALYSYFLAEKLKLNKKDTLIAIYAAMYHDIGRVNDDEDRLHGFLSAKKLEQLELDITNNDFKLLQTIITFHSINDDEFYEMIKDYKNKERITTLFKILKDSDALDRTRLAFLDSIDLNYIRLEDSLKLVPLAYEIFYLYNK